MALGEPFGCFFSLEGEVVVACADFHLEGLDFDDVGLGFLGFFFLVLLVREFAVIGDFGDRGQGVRGDFDEVEASIVGLLQGFADGKHAIVFARRAYDADLGCFYLMIDASSICSQLIIV